MGFSGGSQETISNGVDTTVSKLPISGFAFHGGVPIAFAHGRHYSFLVVPQFTVGFATGTLTPQLPANAPPGTAAPPEQDVSGFLFDGGALVGAEIYFGFIGVPQLALQAAVGLSYRRTTVKWKSGSNSASDGTNTFGTNLHADPWAIFQDTI
jgi:hypothetical protein